MGIISLEVMLPYLFYMLAINLFFTQELIFSCLFLAFKTSTYYTNLLSLLIYNSFTTITFASSFIFSWFHYCKSSAKFWFKNFKIFFWFGLCFVVFWAFLLFFQKYLHLIRFIYPLPWFLKDSLWKIHRKGEIFDCYFYQ